VVSAFKSRGRSDGCCRVCAVPSGGLIKLLLPCGNLLAAFLSSWACCRALHPGKSLPLHQARCRLRSIPVRVQCHGELTIALQCSALLLVNRDPRYFLELLRWGARHRTCVALPVVHRVSLSNSQFWSASLMMSYGVMMCFMAIFL
jgi:hypothetical protein